MTATTLTPTVSLQHVSKRYARGAEIIVAVDDASLELWAGSSTVISGPSGSGKTTLLNLVIGWDTPDDGLIAPAVRQAGWSALAVVPQRLGLIESITIAENVALPGRVRPLAIAPLDMMERLGIAHLAARFPGEVSLGEQQRAACARALAAQPAMLVADEPTSHQDAVNTERITAELAHAAANGCAVVVATHDPRVAVHATQRYSLVDGRLAPAEIR